VSTVSLNTVRKTEHKFYDNTHTEQTVFNQLVHATASITSQELNCFKPVSIVCMLNSELCHVEVCVKVVFVY